MRIAVVGAGITGLTVAHQLLKKRHQVTVFERGDPGGLAGGVPFPGIDGVYLDKYYHHIFSGDDDIINLIAEHGLEPDLMWLPSRSGIFAHGKTWPFGGPRDLLACSPVGSLWQRLLMGWNLLYFQRKSDWKELDRIRCREFFERRCNTAGYENLWEPLLRMKFADAFDDVPASFLWGRVHARAGSRTKGKETLGYLRGGFQRLINAMVDSIRQRGGTVSTADPVLQIIPGNQPEVVSEKGRGPFDRVVWTIGLTTIPALVKDIPAEIQRKAKAIEYMAATCLVMIMRKRQGDFYWLNNIDPSVTFGAVIEHTNLVPPEDYDGHHIVYVLNYHRPDSDLHGLTADQVLVRHSDSLRRLFDDFSHDDIVSLHLFKDINSCPLYDLRFSEKMPPYQGWFNNVDICGMPQVYPVDRNMNACVQNALRYAEQCCE